MHDWERAVIGVVIVLCLCAMFAILWHLFQVRLDVLEDGSVRVVFCLPLHMCQLG